MMASSALAPLFLVSVYCVFVYCVSDNGSDDSHPHVKLFLRTYDFGRWRNQDQHCIQPYGVFPHQTDCDRFVVCVNNRPEIRDCPANQVFTKYGECVEGGECVLERDITSRNLARGPQPEWECPDEFAVYPLQDDCSKFLMCVGGQMVLMSCPKGRTFSFWAGHCVEGENPDCAGPRNCTLDRGGRSPVMHSDFRCPAAYGQFSDFQDCTVYHECVDGVAHLRACKPGKSFDHLLSKCRDTEKAQCLYRCRQPNGDFPHLNNCKKFIRCVNGRPRVASCPQGQAFDDLFRTCVASEYTKCSSEPSGTDRVEQTDFNCPESFGNFPDVMRCSNYWSCNDTVSKSRSCPRGMLFNAETMKCDKASNVTCPPYKSGKQVVCYFDNSDGTVDNAEDAVSRFQPEMMSPYLCTHLHYRHAKLDPSTLLLKPSVPSRDIGQRFYERITDLKRLNPRLKVLLSLGGWRDSGDRDKYSRLVRDPIRWDNFTAYAAGLLTQYGFDGLEVDWEFPVCRTPRCAARTAAQDRDNFSLFLQHVHSTFSTALHPLLLTIKVSGDENIINAAYDVPAISNAVDYITVMAYLGPGIAQRRAEHPARLYPDPTNMTNIGDAESIMNYWKRLGAPKQKLILGIRADGRKYLLADPNSVTINAPISIPPYPRDVHYSMICEYIKTQHWTLVRDKYAGPYMYRDRTWIGYQDPKAVHQKADFVLRKNYAGVALIGSASDDHSAACCRVRNPLLQAIAVAFNKRRGQSTYGFGCPMRGRDFSGR